MLKASIYKIHNQRIKSSNHIMRFKEAYRWTYDEEKLYSTFLESPILHLCCGKSLLGDVRVDIDSKVRPDIVSDQLHLPFKNQSFQTAIYDPPWINNQNAWAGYELARVVRKRVVAISGTFWVEIPKPFVLKHIFVLKKVSPVVKLVFVYENPHGELGVKVRNFRRF